MNDQVAGSYIGGADRPASHGPGCLGHLAEVNAESAGDVGPDSVAFAGPRERVCFQSYEDTEVLPWRGHGAGLDLAKIAAACSSRPGWEKGEVTFGQEDQRKQ